MVRYYHDQFGTILFSGLGPRSSISAMLHYSSMELCAGIKHPLKWGVPTAFCGQFGSAQGGLCTSHYKSCICFVSGTSVVGDKKPPIHKVAHAVPLLTAIQGLCYLCGTCPAGLAANGSISPLSHLDKCSWHSSVPYYIPYQRYRFIFTTQYLFQYQLCFSV